MKLENLVSMLGNNDHQRMDLDFQNQLGAHISKQITELERLVSMLPDNADLCGQLTQLKNQLSSRLPKTTAMIEDQNPAPTILDYDPTKVLGQQRAHIHGIGTASVGYLPSKIIREIGFADDIIKEIDLVETTPDTKTIENTLELKYQELAKWTKQAQRTATTLANGVSEIIVKKQLGNIFPSGTKIDETANIKSAVKNLESFLRNKITRGDTLSYEIINKAMHSISHQDDCHVDDLHHQFRTSHNGLTPDDWAKALRSGEIEESMDIDDLIRVHNIMEMYETMRVGLGDKSWIAITKRLKSQGIDQHLIEEIIDRAIIRSTNL